MAKLIHRVARDQILADAGLTLADAATFDLARKVAAHVRTLGLAGLDITDPDDRAALATAVGVSDPAALQKAVNACLAAGVLVTGF